MFEHRKVGNRLQSAEVPAAEIRRPQGLPTAAALISCELFT